MRGMAIAGLVLLTATGCYSTRSLEGDATGDPVIEVRDTTVEPAMDTGPEVAPDAGFDVVPPCPPPEPEPTGPVPYFEIDDSAWPLGSGEIVSDCLVENVEEGVTEYSYTISLICMDTMDRHTIYVRADVPIHMSLSRDEMVDFWYIWDDVGWYPVRWFVLRYRLEGLIVTGGEGREIPMELDEMLFAPLEIAVFEYVCPRQEDECGTFERTGFRVSLDGETRLFHDRTRGILGLGESAQVLVGPSFIYHDMECDDMPDRFVSTLVFMNSEG